MVRPNIFTNSLRKRKHERLNSRVLEEDELVRDGIEEINESAIREDARLEVRFAVLCQAVHKRSHLADGFLLLRIDLFNDYTKKKPDRSIEGIPLT